MRRTSAFASFLLALLALSLALPARAEDQPAGQSAPAARGQLPPDGSRAQASRAPASGWRVGLGLAPVFAPAWQGSKDTALSIFPDLRLNKGDTLFLSVRDGLGWNAINRGGWKAGPLVKLRFGRNEDDGGSPFLIAGGSTALRGMGDIGAAGEAGVFVEKRFGPRMEWRARAELRQGFGGHEGAIGDVQIARTGRSGRLLFSVGPRATFAGRDFVRTYFGVDEAEAQRTGLAVSRPDGGLLSWGLGGTLTRPLTLRSAVTAIAGVDRLGGEPARSALIRERGRRTQVSLGLAYGVQFGL
ncbi:MipA/OmpV family protein [Novosphingobium huizhouense]|uniref:MipA/OmpV family protein n=1 Tax=Novosphingobium huizhouense TaxID=2866625 RepID=UPI001CD88BC2|nr:MipA/OmpV family protein [Novosphingobium huizhouense]